MKSIYLVLLTLLFSVGIVSAQTYNINQNLSFTPVSTSDCYATTVEWDDGNWKSNPISVNVTHDIPGSSTVSNLNQYGWRTMTYKIYHDDNGTLTLVKTIVHDERYLLPAQSVSQLGLLDLQGVPAGKTQIHLSVTISFSSSSPFVLNVGIPVNGVTNCYSANAEANPPLVCDLGMIDCFTRQVCDANLAVSGYASTCIIYGIPGDPDIYVPCYTYSVNVTGGSGNFSYYWSAYDGNNWVHSTSSTFHFNYYGKGQPIVYLYVTDNVTGCTYQWDSLHSPKTDETDGLSGFSKPTLEAFPNPIAQQGMLNVRYLVPEAVTASASVALYDLQGRVVQELAPAGSLQVGSNELEAMLNLAPGMYFIGLRTNEGMVTQKVVVTD